MLDSILLVRGETKKTFQLGIGVDLTHPMQQAVELLTPPSVYFHESAATSPANASWLLHLSAKNVQSTHLSPVVEDAKICGFRTRLLETDGRGANVKMGFFRPIASARKLDFQGNVLGECDTVDGVVRLNMAGHEWAEVEARW